MIPTENLRRVAIIVSVLPQDEARQLMLGLHEHQISAVLLEISQLRHMSLQDRLPVLMDFVKSHMQHAEGGSAAAVESQVKLRYDALPSAGAFQFLDDVPADRIAEELADEQSHTIAVVLAHLPARQVSQIVQHFPEQLRTLIMARLAELGPTDREIIRDIERNLESRLMDCVSKSVTQLGGVHFVADVLRESDPDTEHRMLDHIAHQDPRLGSVLKQSVHRFSDIFKLPDRDLRLLLRHVDTSQWAVALRGMDVSECQRIVDNLEPVVADSLRQQMAWIGPVRKENVARVRERILRTMRRLRSAKILSGREVDAVPSSE